MSQDKTMPDLQGGVETDNEEEVLIEMKLPARFYQWVHKLAETSGETEEEVCRKLVQISLLDLEKRAHDSTQQIPKKSPVITKVGNLDDI